MDTNDRATIKALTDKVKELSMEVTLQREALLRFETTLTNAEKLFSQIGQNKLDIATVNERVSTLKASSEKALSGQAMDIRDAKDRITKLEKDPLRG